jgi:hypothetical protein
MANHSGLTGNGGRSFAPSVFGLNVGEFSYAKAG